MFTTAVPLPSWFLRNLAWFSGTHVYDEADDVVYADSRMVAVHAVKPERRVIHLPRRCRVEDLVTGRPVARSVSQMVVIVHDPVTRWLRLSVRLGNVRADGRHAIPVARKVS